MGTHQKCSPHNHHTGESRRLIEKKNIEKEKDNKVTPLLNDKESKGDS